MNNEYICNDDGIVEELKKVRSMTNEEFENYVKHLKEREKNKLKEKK